MDQAKPPTSDWVVTELSTTGHAHLLKGVECQDAHASLKGDDWVIMAVSDGHGSEKSPFSKIGAELAVHSFVEEAYRVFKDLPKAELGRFKEETETAFADFPKSMVKIWRQKLDKRFASISKAIRLEWPEDKPTPYKWFGCTLLGSVVFSDKMAVYFQLGDGDVLKVVEGKHQRVFPPKEQLGTETFSLSSTNAVEVAQTSIQFECPEAVLLATDGIGDSCPTDAVFDQIVKYYQQQTKETPALSQVDTLYWIERFQELEGVRELVVSTSSSQLAHLHHILHQGLAQISRNGVGDDNTLLIAQRRL